MKQQNLCILIALLGIINASIPAVHAQEVQLTGREGARYATATGSATVEVAPDNVAIGFGVNTWDKDLRKAYGVNASRTKAILDLATKYHIANGDIQTNDFDVDPTYPEDSKGHSLTTGVPTGYKVKQRIMIRLRNVDSLSNFLADAFDKGANTVGYIKFDVSTMRKFRDEATQLAIQAAKEKASDMANQLNAKLGKALIVKEGILDFRAFGSNYVPNNRLVSSEYLSADRTYKDSSIAAGAQQISSTVTVVFEMTD